MNLNIIKKRLVDEYPQLRKVLSVNYGLDWEKVEEDKLNEKNYIMGASDDKIPWEILNKNSNWLPEAQQMIHEVQRGIYFDSMGCTGYALNNAEELIRINRGYGVGNNSDRFLNKISGTTERGNSLDRVLEARRKYGFIEEEKWGWNEKFSWNEYYAPIPQDIKDEAKANGDKYLFGYDGVWTTKSMLNEALKYSPLYCGVYAWYKKGMVYISLGSPNHASIIINRNTYMAYDTYEPYIKHLDEGFRVYYVKRIFLKKIENKREEYLNDGVRFVMRTEKEKGAHGEFYKVTKEGLEYFKTEQEIKNVIASTMNLTMNLEDLIKVQGKLKPITEEEFIKLNK